jgi:hypothetical protein
MIFVAASLRASTTSDALMNPSIVPPLLRSMNGNVSFMYVSPVWITFKFANCTIESPSVCAFST